MSSYSVECATCQAPAAPDSWWLCEEEPSHGVLTVVYKEQSLTPQFPLLCSLEWDSGIGNTPLLALDNLSQQYGANIYGKNESQNPTGSFKARGTPLEIAKAKEYGLHSLVVATTGNMGVDLATHGAKKDMKVTVVMPAKTTSVKIDLIKRSGAVIVPVDGSYDDCVLVAQKLAHEQNMFLCGDYALRREGQKTLGWELAQSKKLFDTLIVQVGNGNLLTAIAKGWKEATSKPIPRIIAVQPSATNPISHAWRNQQPLMQHKGYEKTRAAGFDVGNPLDGNAVLSIVSETDGMFIDVTDEEMTTAQAELHQREGVVTELSGAASLAAFKQISHLLQEQTVGFIFTGSGLTGI